MKRLFVTLILAGAMTFGASDVQAQESSFTFGPGVAFHDDFDLGIGAWASVPMPSIHEQISLWGSFLYFFPDLDLNYWELNGGLAYAFPVEGAITPFVSAGLIIARVSVDDVPDVLEGFGYDGSSTDIGLNLGGGIRTMLGESLVGVAGARLEIKDGSGFVIEAGLGFPMGG